MATDFFRKKVDGQPDQLINASTNKAIGPTAFGNGAGFNEVKAPTVDTTKQQDVPKGATLISGPSGLQGLNESQIFRANNGDIFKLAPNNPDITPDSNTDNVNGDIVSEFDIKPLLDQQTELRQKYLDLINSSGQKSPEEIKTEADLAKLREQRQGEIRTAEGRIVPAGLIRGEKAGILEKFQQDESNLIASLGLEKEARQASDKAKLAGAETGLGFISQDIEFKQKLDEAQAQAIKNAAEAASKLQEGARASLRTILEMSKGKTLNELDESTQQQIAQLAADSGLPLDVLNNSLQVAKDSLAIQRIKEQADINAKNRSGADTSATKFKFKNTNALYAAGLNADQVSSLEKDIASNGIESAMAGYGEDTKGLIRDAAFGQQEITRSDVVGAINADIESGVPFIKTFDTVMSGGEDVNDYLDSIDKSIINRINQLISERKSEEDIRQTLSDEGIWRVYPKEGPDAFSSIISNADPKGLLEGVLPNADDLTTTWNLITGFFK